jgi:hypothetical protein
LRSEQSGWQAEAACPTWVGSLWLVAVTVTVWLVVMPAVGGYSVQFTGVPQLPVRPCGVGVTPGIWQVA